MASRWHRYPKSLPEFKLAEGTVRRFHALRLWFSAKNPEFLLQTSNTGTNLLLSVALWSTLFSLFVYDQLNSCSFV